ncbi:biotin/lipoyl-binding protein, partial [Cupriavidus sp. UME77]|uniref:biotin/lipoyl-binding protein n=1 Tax=Cupriavidus sp. UME77 TaxID=1862321 RepID=UPI0027152398
MRLSGPAAQVKREDVPIGLSGVGTVQAMATVTVKPRVDGQLDRVGFVEGQDVKAGQLLAQIDPRTFQAQLQQA